LKASLLFYKKLTADLLSIGFELNPYDPCVANKMVGGSQMTLCWHVDDMKISHKEVYAVDDMILWLRRKYEEIMSDGEGKMTVRRGKVHDYLGMTLNFSVLGEVKIDMVEYIESMVNDFHAFDESDKTALTPAAEHLFQVRDDAPKLSEKLARVFHNFAARGLFATKRARPDIHTAIAFLTTRVREPDEDDWKKLRRMMRYLRGTKNLALTLSGDEASIIKEVEWWIDGAHTVHSNMRSQTGQTSSLGKGCLMSASVKQKLNTRSSTETEVVAVDDAMPQVLWTNYFLKAQGYAPERTVIYQDNESAILLEKNGKGSSSKRTKHINVRYYFIKDRIDSGEVCVEHCPATEMIGDFFTKPLQGALFVKFRSIIMNIKDK
jgi:hypothetical protein